MKKYELTLVLSSRIDDEARAAALAKAQGYVERFGGTVTDVEEWGKKKLAYEIQKMDEAYYYFVHFDAEPEAPAQIESHIRIMEPVVRYLCVKTEA